jgi:phage baseplate assembly protein W
MTAIVGLSRTDGATLDGTAHLIQSIADILTTRKGQRRMRPDYGSNLPDMVDQPMNAGWVCAAQAEIADALGRWEPRIALTKVIVEGVTEGRVNIRVQGEYLGDSVILNVAA